MPDPKPEHGFWLIAVHPDWAEPSQLLGYVDSVLGRFVKHPFVLAVEQANANPNRPVFVCLDEMNLAQPEFYFADVLSAMEVPGSSLRLHSHSPAVGVDPELTFPPNLYITGTVNVDETTRPFSPKVLDRAQTIDLGNKLRLSAYWDSPAGQQALAPIPEARRREIRGLLERINDVLRNINQHFGYRTASEILKFLEVMVCVTADDQAAWEQAVDGQLVQKVLTKLRGGDSSREKKALTELAGMLKEGSEVRAVVERMREDQKAHGSFQFWK